MKLRGKKERMGEEREITFSHAGILESRANSTQHGKQTVCRKPGLKEKYNEELCTQKKKKKAEVPQLNKCSGLKFIILILGTP